MTSEPEDPLIADEPPAETVVAASAGEALGGRSAADADPALATPSLLGSMPVGVQVGTFVHRVLEATEFDAADLQAELATRVSEIQGRRSVDVGDPAAVVAGLTGGAADAAGAGARRPAVVRLRPPRPPR